MISKDKAQELVEAIKDTDVACLQYLGIKTVPYSRIKPPYRTFPTEIIDQKVHVFEGLSFTDKSVSNALCHYYVDLNGNVYKDTYVLDRNCAKIQ